jgi:hypothetical protein
MMKTAGSVARGHAQIEARILSPEKGIVANVAAQQT